MADWPFPSMLCSECFEYSLLLLVVLVKTILVWDNARMKTYRHQIDNNGFEISYIRVLGCGCAFKFLVLDFQIRTPWLKWNTSTRNRLEENI